MKKLLILFILLLPLAFALQPVSILAPYIAPQAPCTPVSVNATILSPSPQTIIVSVLPPYNKYLIIVPQAVSASLQPKTVMLKGQLPCQIAGLQNIELMASSLSGQQLAKKTVVLPVTADYAYSVKRLQPLDTCADEKTKRQFVLQNRGNTPNVYTLSRFPENAAGKIMLLPRHEKIFSLSYVPGEARETILVITPEYGKTQRYRLYWNVTQCTLLSLDIPEEISACKGKNATVQYEVANNGTRAANLTLTFGHFGNQTHSVEAQKSVNASFSFAPDEKKIPLTISHNGIQKTTTLLVHNVPYCARLGISPFIRRNNETFSANVTNNGPEGETFIFSFERAEEFSLLTETLTLARDETGTFVITGNITKSRDINIIATAGNVTQLLHAYLSVQEGINWKRLDEYGYYLGPGILAFIVLVCIGSLLSYLIKRKPEGDFAKPSFFSRLTYDKINFDNLFDESESYKPITLPKPYPLRKIFLASGLFFLLIGSAGIFTLYPEIAGWLIILVGILVACGAVAGLFLWLGMKRIFSFFSWKWLLGILLIATLYFNYEAVAKSLAALEGRSTLLVYAGAVLVIFFLIVLLHKVRQSWAIHRRRKNEEKKMLDLAEKITHVEKQAHALKENLSGKTLFSRLYNYFSLSPKPLWQYIIDFFFQDVPDDFPNETHVAEYMQKGENKKAIKKRKGSH